MSTVTRVMVRNSERSDFTDCRWRWWQAYMERIRPVGGGMDALVFGDIIHRAQAAYYIPERNRKQVVRGPHPAITVEKIFNALELSARRRQIPSIIDTESSEWVDAKELGIGMMEAYVKHYGNDEKVFVVYPEMPFQYDVFTDDGKYICTLVGTTDALIRDRSTWEMGLFEHKTAAQIQTSHLMLDEQASTYWTIIPMWLREQGVLKPDQDLHFMWYNFMRKTVISDDRPRNAQGAVLKKTTMAQMREALEKKDIIKVKGLKREELIALCESNEIDWPQLAEVAATQPADLFHRETVPRNYFQRTSTMHRIMAQVREMQLVRHGQLEVYKRPSKNCGWCQYKDLCEIDDMGQDTEDFVEAAFYHWNPYRDHIWSLQIA
jgi:hypothetical protein